MAKIGGWYVINNRKKEEEKTSKFNSLKNPELSDAYSQSRLKLSIH